MHSIAMKDGDMKEKELAVKNYWHGHFQIPEETAGFWQIGPMSLWIQHLRGEWRIARETGCDPLSEAIELTLPTEIDSLLNKEIFDRFSAINNSDSVGIMPALADRSIVARPEKPFHIPKGGKATVFVGSPLWFQVSVGSPDSLLLLDKPIFRPSDTWFGPNSREGELCYASRSFLRISLDKLPRRPHRAFTAVNILNCSNTQLDIESLNLPVSQLTLYKDADGQLWTQDVTFERNKDGGFASFRTKSSAPSYANNAVILAEPRQKGVDNMVVRAFSAMFSYTG